MACEHALSLHPRLVQGWTGDPRSSVENNFWDLRKKKKSSRLLEVWSKTLGPPQPTRGEGLLDDEAGAETGRGQGPTTWRGPRSPLSWKPGHAVNGAQCLPVHQIFQLCYRRRC